jgi:hypothetical protein
MRQLVEWPGLHDAPEVRRRLRAIRPNAELLYTWDGIWMLGTVEPNEYRRREARKLLRLYEERVVADVEMPREKALLLHRGFWRDAALLYQGFLWIRDYHGDPDGRIVEDFRRMCWKEDHGQLDKEYLRMIANSSDEVQLERKVNWWYNEGRYGLKNALRYTSRRPVRFDMKGAAA